MKNLPKLVASDIGGTLTSSSRPIGSRTADVFKQLLDKDIPVALVTGFNYFTTRHYTQDLDPRTILIIQNGTTCFQGEEITWEKRVEEQTALDVVNLFSIREMPLFLYKGLAEKFQIYYKNTEPDPAKGTLPLSQAPNYKNVTEISTRIPTSTLLEVQQLLEKILNGRAQVIVSKGPELSWLEVTPFCVRKDQALKELCLTLDIPVGDVIYFGDNLNDVEALRLVGYPVIVENSLPALKEEFHRVIGHVEDESVANYLTHLYHL